MEYRKNGRGRNEARVLLALAVSCMAAVVLLCGICGLCGCDALSNLAAARTGANGKGFVVMSWNLQNLMDGETYGAEHEEFKDAGLWNEEAFKRRVRNICKVIADLDPQPDFIVLQEVENDSVMAYMCQAYLGRLGFHWYGITADKSQSIQTGFISKVPVDAHDVRIAGVPGQRPLLLVHIELERGDLVVIGLHAKSRLDGALETESHRLESSRAIGESVREARRLWPGAVIIAAGDFNEDLDYSARLMEEAARENLDVQPAMAGASDPMASAWGASGSLVISGSRDFHELSGLHGGGAEAWHCFWEDSSIPLQKDGSCCYKGIWNKFDNILCSKEGFDGLGLEFGGAGVHCGHGLCTPAGLPSRFEIKLGSGLSDHLPVWLRLI